MFVKEETDQLQMIQAARVKAKRDSQSVKQIMWLSKFMLWNLFRPGTHRLNGY